MMSLIIGLLVMLLLTVLYAVNKLRNMHLLVYQVAGAQVPTSDNLYRQLEALHALHHELALKQALPPLRGWAASPDFLLALERQARRQKPQTVVECSSGASTAVLARCMQLNGGGKVYSLEHDPEYASRTRAELVRMELQEYAEVLDAPLKEIEIGGQRFNWYDLSALPDDVRIDLLAIDGPPMHSAELARYPAGPMLFGRMNDHATVFLDDASRPAEQAILARWRDEFPQMRQESVYCEKGCAVLRKQ
jgi:hypothetical protein